MLRRGSPRPCGPSSGLSCPLPSPLRPRPGPRGHPVPERPTIRARAAAPGTRAVRVITTRTASTLRAAEATTGRTGDPRTITARIAGAGTREGPGDRQGPTRTRTATPAGADPATDSPRTLPGQQESPQGTTRSRRYKRYRKGNPPRGGEVQPGTSGARPEAAR